MSRENVELARRCVDAFNERDLDALLALMHEDVEGAPPLASIEGSYHGHVGIRRWWESLFSGLPDFTIEIVEVWDLGEATVAVLQNRAHGVSSEALVEQRLWLAGRWRDGKVAWWRTFHTEAEALEAVGLPQ